LDAAIGLDLFEQGDGQASEQSEVGSGVEVLGAAVVFPKGDIEYPMQAVPDLPVQSDLRG
jgi:hypothetical protein